MGPAAAQALALRVVGTPVRILAPEGAIRELFALCYARLLDPSSGDAADPIEASVAASGAASGGGFLVRVSGREDAVEPDAPAAVRRLNHELLHAVMLRAPARFFVHAGVVAWKGRALILPGLSQAGKSTLVLALLQAGAAFLSDELLVFDPARRVAEPFARAVKIRDVCVPYFEAWRPWFTGEGEGRFLDPAADGLRFAPEAGVPPAAVVLPRWDPEGSGRPERISRGEAYLGLAASALNFGSHRTSSLDHLGAICSDARTFTMAWREPHAAAARILEAVEAPGP